VQQAKCTEHTHLGCMCRARVRWLPGKAFLICLHSTQQQVEVACFTNGPTSVSTSVRVDSHNCVTSLICAGCHGACRAALQAAAEAAPPLQRAGGDQLQSFLERQQRIEAIAHKQQLQQPADGPGAQGVAVPFTYTQAEQQQQQLQQQQQQQQPAKKVRGSISPAVTNLGVRDAQQLSTEHVLCTTPGFCIGICASVCLAGWLAVKTSYVRTGLTMCMPCMRFSCCCHT